MSDEWQAYVQDVRKICKFAEKCYQKNPQHHETYKHPPVTKKRKVEPRRGKKDRFSPYLKKKKGTDSNKDVPSDTEPPDTQKQDSGESSVSCNQDTDDKEPESSSQQQDEFDECNANMIIQLPNNPTYHDSTTLNEKYKELFLVEMPPDFFKFYECLKGEPDMDKLLSSVNLQLIGPYDLLWGKLPVLENKESYLIHWRFFYDPPELQAVLKSKDTSEFHIGYYRDDPKALPVFMAYNDSSKGCNLSPFANNIFGAVYLYLEMQKKSPFTAMAYKKMTDKVKGWAETHNYSLEKINPGRRTKECTTKTLHGAGILVPYDKKTQLGYRRLVETDANLKSIFQKLREAKSEKQKDLILSELQPVITYANIAVDECDFGTGLEAGIDMFCSGLRQLEAPALNSLCSVYSLLNRAEFGMIIQFDRLYSRGGPIITKSGSDDGILEKLRDLFKYYRPPMAIWVFLAHLKCRRKGPSMSAFNFST